MQNVFYSGNHVEANVLPPINTEKVPTFYAMIFNSNNAAEMTLKAANTSVSVRLQCVSGKETQQTG